MPTFRKPPWPKSASATRRRRRRCDRLLLSSPRLSGRHASDANVCDAFGWRLTPRPERTGRRTRRRSGKARWDSARARGLESVPVEVDDIEGAVARLREEGGHFRNDIVTGVGGKQVLVEDPSGNPVELFEPTRSEARR